METLSESIKNFLSVDIGSGYGDGSGNNNGCDYDDGFGDGYGDGSGDGFDDVFGDNNGCTYGDGSGYGYGDGSGYGSGSGDGFGSYDGSGYGTGSGYGISEFNGQQVYIIDGLQTIIESVHANYAKGFILSTDFILYSCFIAKADNRYFAHGGTLHDALTEAMNKAFEDMPEDERIKAFISEYPMLQTIARNIDLYAWHNRLTGSCSMGCDMFAKEHGIDVENGEMTIKQFIKLTESSYGSSTIAKLKDAYLK